MAPKEVMILNGSIPEVSVEVPLIFVGGRWNVDPRVYGEPLYPTGDPYLDDSAASDDDPALVAARATPLPDGAELGQLLRDAESILNERAGQ